LRLLLDTHIVIWWATGSRLLGAKARDLIVADDADLIVSAATWWELAIKRTLGRLDIDFTETRRDLEKREIKMLSVSFDHAEAAAALPRLHRDPFDRMLVAQASAEQLILVTRDSQLAAYGPMVLLV
jgi:PIN domain nuclease of toxin-antitoxin system